MFFKEEMGLRYDVPRIHLRCYCCQELCPEHAIELKVDRSKKIMIKTIGGIAKASRLVRELLTK